MLIYSGQYSKDGDRKTVWRFAILPLRFRCESGVKVIWLEWYRATYILRYDAWDGGWTWVLDGIERQEVR